MKSSSPVGGFEAFRSVDFNWAIRLQDVWRDAAGDVPALHQNARREVIEEIERLQRETDDVSPLGRFILGEAGAGKTHLLGAIRQEVARRGHAFILVDMTDVHDFWETVAQGYLNSLQAPYLDGKPQYRLLLDRLLQKVRLKEGIAEPLQALARQKPETLSRNIQWALSHLQRTFPVPVQRHQDTIRALLCLNSVDLGIVNTGLAWLQSLEIDDEPRRAFGFQKPRETPREVVRALSWIISLAGPCVLAFDQLDPIVHQVARQADPIDAEERNAARLLLDRIGNGLAAIRETTVRTLVVVSCLEASYKVLTKEVLHSNLDRFRPPTRLQYPLGTSHLLIEARLRVHYAASPFQPPYPTWPFAPAAIQALQGTSPRRLFQMCAAHQRRCIDRGEVVELLTFDRADSAPAPVEGDPFADLDREFDRLRAEADLNALRKEKSEHDPLGLLYQTALQCLILERGPTLPEDVVAYVDQEFGGAQGNPPLHARLRLQFQREGDREEHFCIRVLLRKNARSVQSRLKAAMTQAGIDPKLSFRKLTIVRFEETSSGPVTKDLVDRFLQMGGRFHAPGDEELRTVWAVGQMALARHAAWEAWLVARGPLTRVGLGHALAPGSLFDPRVSAPGRSPSVPAHPAPPQPRKESMELAEPSSVPAGENRTANPPRPDENAVVPHASAATIFLGHRVILGEAHDPVALPLSLLEKHTFVVAGAGSGKTVLLKHLIEEAALAGIPSIVIDGANDLATLGEAWPAFPLEFGPAEKARAARYFAAIEPVLWTPGTERGNPLQLNPLPDFTEAADDEEALQEAVGIAVDGLADLMATGSPTVREKKISILRRVLQYFAERGGGTLDALIALLCEPPAKALLGIDRELKLARELADTLKVRRENNPLLRSSGTPLDFAALFGEGRAAGTTRVSVVNLSGLGDLTNQQQFLNQLAMALFDWAKKNPQPPAGRALRGLFVLDEAKDFVPGRTTTACKSSLLRCAAQLRKYHVALVFATQNPKDLEPAIGGNCSTHFYGKVSSPSAIETVQDLMRQKGGSGSDVANLPRGVFYVHNADADFRQPTKIRVPLCLSHHRSSPPTAEEIIEMSRRFRPQ